MKMSSFDKIVDGKIYVLFSDLCEKFYIGATTVSLEERLERHDNGYEEWLTSNFKTSYVSSFEILKYGDYRMELLEDCPQILGWDLVKREQYHQIINYYDLVNIIIPGRKNSKNIGTRVMYDCVCGCRILNLYHIRKKHSMSNKHRTKIRDIHLEMVKNNPKFEISYLDEE